MEGLLHKAGLQSPPDPSANFADVERLEMLYRDLARHEAFKDYMRRIHQVYSQTISQLRHGTLDKHGNQHDDECRAVLVCLERMLSFRPALARTYDSLKKRHDDLMDKAKEKQLGIHGPDRITGNWGSRSPFGRRQI